jgi:hypothetical protein
MFSSVAGRLASDVEDQAAQGLLEEVRPLLARFETMARELMHATSDLSIEALHR